MTNLQELENIIDNAANIAFKTIKAGIPGSFATQLDLYYTESTDIDFGTLIIVPDEELPLVDNAFLAVNRPIATAGMTLEQIKFNIRKIAEVLPIIPNGEK